MGNCCSSSLQSVEAILSNINKDDLTSIYNSLVDLYNIYESLTTKQKVQVKELSQLYFVKKQLNASPISNHNPPVHENEILSHNKLS